MTGISVVIITKNEERNLPRCLDSVEWADEVVIVDSGSADRTVEIAVDRGARVIEIEWKGYGPAKQSGVDAAQGPWVLAIDADEEVTEALTVEIQNAVASNAPIDGYCISRRTNFLGRWIFHCGWYPDRILRLFRKSHGRFDDAVIHEKVLLDGKVGELKNDLLHYSYPDLETYLERSNRYTTTGAEQLYLKGRRTNLFDLTLRPLVSFISHYFVRLGFLDGGEGLMISALSAHAVFVKYSKLYKLHRRKDYHREVIHGRAKAN